MMMAWPDARETTASYMSAAETTGTTATPSGGASETGPETRVTAAPRLRAAAASSYPIRPVEWLVTNRTGSIASRVGPAVTSRRTPSRSRSVSAARTASKSTAGSGSRPRPVSPQASRPLSGSSTVKPKPRSVSRLRWVTGLSYMPVFIAGATILGQRAASTVVVSMSSATPAANLAITLAVAGAISMTSAFFASATCSTSYS